MRRMEGDLAQGEFSFFIFAMIASERTGTSASTMDEARVEDRGSGRFCVGGWAGGEVPLLRGKNAAGELRDPLSSEAMGFLLAVNAFSGDDDEVALGGDREF